MRIESQSLPAYIYGLPREESYGFETISNVWKQILMFPTENWDPFNDHSKQSESILDPARTLARMLCVKMDRHLKTWIDRITRKSKISKKETITLSWALRIADEREWEWDPGEVLMCVRDNSNGFLHEDVDEIRLRFPELFTELDADEKYVKNVEGLIKKSYDTFQDRQLIHISAPKFHKVWNRLIETDGDSEDAIKAKQQWSMRANRDFEWYCKKTCDEEEGKGSGKRRSIMLQTGGGHVLILTPILSADGPGEMLKYAEKKLQAIKEYFEGIEGQHWAPLLWASWNNGQSKVMPTEHDDPMSLVEFLSEEHGEWLNRREQSMQRWSFFKFGKYSGKTRFQVGDGQRAIFYLDVMGLGDHCWPHTEDEGRERDEWDPPNRKRANMVEGFLKSRRITPVIESTFGLVFSKYFPQQVDAMGGDEIVVRMDKANWLPLVTSVEDHCLKIHSSIFPEEPRLLWWAMCREEGEEGVRNTNLMDFSGMKDALRVIQNTEGPDKKVNVTRFVNPLFIDPPSDEELSDTGYEPANPMFEEFQAHLEHSVEETEIMKRQLDSTLSTLIRIDCERCNTTRRWPDEYTARKCFCRNKWGSHWWKEDKEERLASAKVKEDTYIEGWKCLYSSTHPPQ